MKVLIKNIKTGRYGKIKIGGKVKVGDNLKRFHNYKYILNKGWEDWVVAKVFEEKKKEKKPNLKVYSDVSIGVPGNLVMSYSPARLVESIKDNYQKDVEGWELQELRNRPYFKTIVTGVKGKPRGENLEKIKFPCWCSYFDCGDKRRYGEIDLVFFNGNKRFRLRELRQSKLAEVIYCVYHRDSLESLIEDYDIEILKGELHLWREVK